MDVVVTVPKPQWAEWLREGDLAGVEQPGLWEEEHVYGYTFGPGSHIPDIKPGERVYVASHGKLRGYAPLVEIGDAARFGGKPGGFALIRRNDAVAVTIPVPVLGFQNWRYRWWRADQEIPFPEWRTP